MMTYLKKTACPYDCPTGCGFYAETDGTSIFRILPDPEDPASHGLICGKMRHYEKDIHDPKRILTPLKRTGKKGGTDFSPISWEEAISEISRRWQDIIAAHGPSAISHCCYSGVMSQIQRHCGTAFFRYLGSREMITTLCAGAKGAGYRSVLGHTGCLDPREIKDSDFYLIWGSQLAQTRLQELPDICKGRKQEKKAVLIEVFGGRTSLLCDQTCLIRPGTDGALALAMMHVLKREHLTDTEFMEKESIGFREFYHTLDQYTPIWAAQQTGISAETIEQLALEYGRSRSPVIILGSGNSRHVNGGMTVRLIVLLSLITGAWKRPGGGFVGASPAASAYVPTDLIKRPDFIREQRSININQMGAALSPDAEDPIYSLYVYGNNLACSVSDQSAILKGLSREDLFTVVHERFMTDSARYADIILPAAFSVEQCDIFTPYGYSVFGTSWKIIDPPGECKSNWETFRLLAAAMGFDDIYFKRSEEEMLQYILDHLPCLSQLSSDDLALLKKGGMISMPYADHTNWKTASGKIMVINPELPELERIPCYQPPEDTSFPLHLVSVPAMETLNSIFTLRDSLTQKRGPFRIMIHPEDANTRGIQNHDTVICFNHLAEVEFEACICTDIARGAVAVPGIFQSSQTKNGLGVNALHHGKISRMGSGTTMNNNTVELRLKG